MLCGKFREIFNDIFAAQAPPSLARLLMKSICIYNNIISILRAGKSAVAAHGPRPGRRKGDKTDARKSSRHAGALLGPVDARGGPDVGLLVRGPWALPWAPPRRLVGRWRGCSQASAWRGG